MTVLCLYSNAVPGSLQQADHDALHVTRAIRARGTVADRIRRWTDEFGAAAAGRERLRTGPHPAFGVHLSQPTVKAIQMADLMHAAATAMLPPRTPIAADPPGQLAANLAGNPTPGKTERTPAPNPLRKAGGARRALGLDAGGAVEPPPQRTHQLPRPDWPTGRFANYEASVEKRTEVPVTRAVGSLAAQRSGLRIRAQKCRGSHGRCLPPREAAG